MVTMGYYESTARVPKLDRRSSSEIARRNSGAFKQGRELEELASESLRVQVGRLPLKGLFKNALKDRLGVPQA